MERGPLPTAFEARRLPPCSASARLRAVLGVGRDLRNQRTESLEVQEERTDLLSSGDY